jgi:hypothetical protein
VRNATPNGFISWTDFLLGYGAWLDPVRRGNRSPPYKRNILLEHDRELEEVLEAEFTFHEALRARGCRLHREPTAETTHTNFGRFEPLDSVSHAGRVFAAAAPDRSYAGLSLDTLGQMLGYTFGAGNASRKLYPFGFDRDHTLRRSWDRRKAARVAAALAP